MGTSRKPLVFRPFSAIGVAPMARVPVTRLGRGIRTCAISARLCLQDLPGANGDSGSDEREARSLGAGDRAAGLRVRPRATARGALRLVGLGALGRLQRPRSA